MSVNEVLEHRASALPNTMDVAPENGSVREDDKREVDASDEQHPSKRQKLDNDDQSSPQENSEPQEPQGESEEKKEEEEKQPNGSEDKPSHDGEESAESNLSNGSKENGSHEAESTTNHNDKMDMDEKDEQSETKENNEEGADNGVKKEEDSAGTSSAHNAAVDPPEGAPPGLPKHQQKFAINTIRAVKRLKDAGPFLRPVDAVKLNVPTYYDVIKEPMDLGTMEKKAQKNEYNSLSEFSRDIELVYNNCAFFNGAESPIAKMASNIKTSFDRHMSHAPPFREPTPPPKAPKKKSLPPSSTPKSQRAAAQAANAAVTSAPEPSKPVALQPSGIPTIRRESTAEGGRPKREIHPPKPKDIMYGDMTMRPRKKKFAAELKFCGQVLKELQSKKHEAYSFPFLQPVDPVALNCPTYYDVIKHPMDLSTIQNKYHNGEYENADEFEADIRLMFRNCYDFNPEGSPVNVMGHRLEAVFDRKWTEKPVPAPTPPPPDSDDELSGDENEEEIFASNPLIKMMEEQIAKITQELERLKKEALAASKTKKRRKSKGGGRRSSSAATGAGSGRRGSGVSSQQPAYVTYEMKKELSEKIGTLPEKKLQHVVTIIQESMPHLKNADQDEIELDMDQLDSGTLMKLYTFVVKKEEEKQPQPKKQKRSSSMAPKAKRKSKPLTEEEQSRQIEEIREKIKQFDNVRGPSNNDESSDEDDNPLDDDDSSASSSSEEE